jgi:hypothetical protein
MPSAEKAKTPSRQGHLGIAEIGRLRGLTTLGLGPGALGLRTTQLGLGTSALGLDAATSLKTTLRSFALSGDLHKALSELARPFGASMEGLFPAASLARQVGTTEGFLAAPVLSRQLKDIYATDMVKTFGVATVASQGLGAHVKALEDASRLRASLPSFAKAEGLRAAAEMASKTGIYPLPSMLRERLVPRHEMGALTRGILGGLGATSAQRLGFSGLSAQTLAWSKLSLPTGLGQALEESRSLWLRVERFSKRWEEHALWFILLALPLGVLARFAEMEREEVEEALLCALERVVTNSPYTQALIAALERAPHITDVQRDDLQHGLEHAERGEFERRRAAPHARAGGRPVEHCSRAHRHRRGASSHCLAPEGTPAQSRAGHPQAARRPRVRPLRVRPRLRQSW